MDPTQPKPPQGPLTAEELSRIQATYQRLGGSFYDILNVTPDIDAAALRVAYFELAKRFHPDLYAQRDTGRMLPYIEAIFREVTVAFEHLSRTDTRAAYDSRLKLHAKPQSTAAPTPAPFTSRTPTPAPFTSRAPTPAPFTSRAPTPAPFTSRAPTPNYVDQARRASTHPASQLPMGSSMSPPSGTRRPTPTPPEPRAARQTPALQRRGPVTPPPAILDTATRERLNEHLGSDTAIAQTATLARDAERAGRWALAGETWEKLSKLCPSEHGPLLLAAHAFSEASDDLSHAIDLARHAARVSPDELAVHIALARLYFRAGRTSSARGAVETALRLDPSHPEALSISRKLR